MQMWLFAGFCCLSLSAVLAWAIVQMGSPPVAIATAMVGLVADIACIGRGVWSYVQVLRIKAHERVGKPASLMNYEWLLAVALAVVPLSLYTLWFIKTR